MRPIQPQQTEHLPPGPSRLENKLVAAVLAAVLIALMAPQIAGGYTAGRYNVEACTEAVDYANNSWEASTNNPSYIETHTSCGETPAAYSSSTLANLELGDIVNLTEGVPVGTEGRWKIAAPEGTEIVEVNGYSSLYRQGRSWHVYRESENTKGELNVESTCDSVTTFTCALGGIFQATALKARSMTFGALCTAEEYEPGKYFTTCPNGALAHDVRAGVAYTIVTIEDLNPPEKIIASNVPSEPQHGTVNINASAIDTAAGLLSLAVVTKTGEVVGGPTTVGACDYSQPTPCPTQTENLAIPIDTKKLPNGQNELRVEAVNAAHDQNYSTPFTITVENPPPKSKEENPNGNEETAQTKQESSQNTINTDTTSQVNGSPSTPQNLTSGNTSQTKLLSLLPIHIRAHTSRGKLIIEGSAPKHATGWLWLRINGTLSNKHYWKPKQIYNKIDKGYFQAVIALPSQLYPVQLKLTIVYPGNKAFRRTVHNTNLHL